MECRRKPDSPWRKFSKRHLNTLGTCDCLRYRPRAARPAPSRDRTQRLLAETNLTYLPIAAQTGLTLDGIRNQVRVICVLSASLPDLSFRHRYR